MLFRSQLLLFNADCNFPTPSPLRFDPHISNSPTVGRTAKTNPKNRNRMKAEKKVSPTIDQYENLKRYNVFFYYLLLTWGPVNVGPIGDLFIGALALAPAVRRHQGAGRGLRAGHKIVRAV